jgi:hypothetical protein
MATSDITIKVRVDGEAVIQTLSGRAGEPRLIPSEQFWPGLRWSMENATRKLLARIDASFEELHEENRQRAARARDEIMYPWIRSIPHGVVIHRGNQDGELFGCYTFGAGGGGGGGGGGGMGQQKVQL